MQVEPSGDFEEVPEEPSFQRPLPHVGPLSVFHDNEAEMLSFLSRILKPDDIDLGSQCNIFLLSSPHGFSLFETFCLMSFALPPFFHQIVAYSLGFVGNADDSDSGSEDEEEKKRRLKNKKKREKRKKYSLPCPFAI